MTDQYNLDSGPDPASFAESTPEIHNSDSPVYVIGIGPGPTDFLTKRGEKLIASADVVVGFDSVVEYIKPITDAEFLTCGYHDELQTLDEFAQQIAKGNQGVAVTMGDPNHSGYQFVGKVQQAVDAPVQIIPGISSIQIAASRARTPLEKSKFVTLHKSGGIDDELEQLVEHVGTRHLLILPRPYDWMPEDIAAYLLEHGASPSLSVFVFEHLTQQEEKITDTTLQALQSTNTDDSTYSDLSVLVVRSSS
ncbi:cobalt-precorrin-7 (C(5))-methyltransferase [Salinarchaeum sp. IM2453]|uniref:cobalt-precorrin-7 (C(5))-methyltransferase n=1 Tax=Salinarchaeum sp. IM2453 TaxID=2862870 RepID=UPI001C831587|nr:cobalt-precorrin-7 (C(5))-methyltransferase [Salinarchaeum sp. IM2453]QZA88090.1 cobalt-precorrin-7 (C(5))-methyltransferase [Salinarchaeum sp. IM2453]